jgi:hypothetical protein
MCRIESGNSVGGADAVGVAAPETFVINSVQLRLHTGLGLGGLWEKWIRRRAIIAETKATAYLNK